jgi:hypothetical protein
VSGRAAKRADKGAAGFFAVQSMDQALNMVSGGSYRLRDYKNTVMHVIGTWDADKVPPANERLTLVTLEDRHATDKSGINNLIYPTTAGYEILDFSDEMHDWINVTWNALLEAKMTSARLTLFEL